MPELCVIAWKPLVSKISSITAHGRLITAHFCPWPPTTAQYNALPPITASYRQYSLLMRYQPLNNTSDFTKWIDLLLNRLWMINGSWLMTHGSWLMAQSSWLMARGQERGVRVPGSCPGPGPLGPGPGPRASFFAMSHGPWAWSHEPWAIDHK